MKIVKLQAENIKRLKAVEVEPDPSNPIVVIRGDNGQGKSSLIDSIAMALGGRRLEPPKVVREGAEEAFVVLELDDLVIERRWESDGKSVLEVRDRDGVKQRSPQALLDSLVGRLTFDPLAFLQLDADKTAEAVRKVAGLDFTDLDQQHQQAYDERTAVNREKERAKARLEALPRVAKVVEGIDVNALLKEQDRLLGIERTNNALGEKARAAQAEVEAVKREYLLTKERIKALEQDLANAKLHAGALEEKGKKAREAAETSQKAFDAAEDPDLDLVNVRAKLQEAQAQNEAARKNAERDDLARTLKAREDESDALTEKIDAVRAERERRIAAAKFPVPGLTFLNGALYFNGVPFAQASQAERLRVAVAMGLATNPKVRVLLVRDGSLLDNKSMRLLAELAKEAQAQVWLEVVGKAGAGIVIEDGTVEQVRAA
jgi:energy-coupling factor transporter ATP-binding protein EcfA2